MENCFCMMCVLMSVGHNLNDIFNLFLPICATLYCQTFTVKCIIMKWLFSLKPVRNLI